MKKRRLQRKEEKQNDGDKKKVSNDWKRGELEEKAGNLKRVKRWGCGVVGLQGKEVMKSAITRETHFEIRGEQKSPGDSWRFSKAEMVEYNRCRGRGEREKSHKKKRKTQEER